MLLARTNGCADVPVLVRFDRTATDVRPGFPTRTDRIDGPTTVVVADGAAGNATGDALLACDGVPARAALAIP